MRARPPLSWLTVLGVEMITTTTPELTGETVAIVAVFEFPDESVDKYEKVFEAGGPAVLDQPNRLHHVCYRTDSGFAVVDVWADKQSFAAFGGIIGPATQKTGLDAKPAVHTVQGLVTQDGQRRI